MARTPALAGGQPWPTDGEFRLLVVQRSARGRFSHLIPIWAQAPAWAVRTAQPSELNGLPASGRRPHAVMVDADPGTAGLCLRLFPEARQVLCIDEHFDPVGAAGFDLVACAHWWQRARMPEVMRPRIRVVHPGLPPVTHVTRRGLHTLDGRWLGPSDRPVALPVAGWRKAEGGSRLPEVLVHLLERLTGPVLLIVPPDCTPDWRGLMSDSRVHCVEDPGARHRDALLQMTVLMLCGSSQPDWLLDAMASGCPVLAQDGPVSRELIRDGVTGCIHAADLRTGLLADAAGDLLRDGPKLARMAREAQAEVRREFDVHAAAARYARLFGAVDDEDVLLPPHAAIAALSSAAPFSRILRT